MYRFGPFTADRTTYRAFDAGQPLKRRAAPPWSPAPPEDRRLEAGFLAACAAAVRGTRDEAADRLHTFLDAAPPSAIGWTIPIDPFFRPLRGHPGFARELSRLAETGGVKKTSGMFFGKGRV